MTKTNRKSRILHALLPALCATAAAITLANCGSAPPAACTGNLCGIWKSACTGGPNPFSMTTIAVLVDGAMTVTNGMYNDAACTSVTFGSIAGTSTRTMVNRYTYTVGGAATAPTGATQIQYTTAGSLILQLNAGTKNADNTATCCGFTDWTCTTSCTAKEVTGASCGTCTSLTAPLPGIAYTPAINTTYYDVYSISVNGSNATILSLGDKTGANTGLSSALRPTSFHPTTFFKQ